MHLPFLHLQVVRENRCTLLSGRTRAYLYLTLFDLKALFRLPLDPAALVTVGSGLLKENILSSYF